MFYLSNPLKRMKVTQDFGENLVGEGFYANLGIPSDKHNGVDLSAVNVPIYAEADGRLECRTSSDGSNNIRLWVPWGDSQLEIMHFHCSEMAPDGMNVKRGEQIGITGNSGKYTTGPHLHLGVRIWGKDGIKDSNNGYGGCINPKYVFPLEWLDLPVDKRYGNNIYTPGVPSDLAFYATNVWFYINFKRLMTTRERNAFQFGFWDLRTVLDDAQRPVWEEMSKPEAIKRGIVKAI